MVVERTSIFITDASYISSKVNDMEAKGWIFVKAEGIGVTSGGTSRVLLHFIKNPKVEE